MSAPRRWKDSPDAPIGVRELLSSARTPTTMSARSFERGAKSVAKLGAVPAAAALSIWAKIAAAGLVSASAISAVVWVERLERHEQPSVASPVVASSARASVAPQLEAPPPASEESAPPMPTESLSRAPLARPSTARAPQGPRASARAGEASPLAPEPSASVAPPIDAPSREPSTLAGELELLERARRSLADDPHGALEALGLHVARYPSGILAVERDLMTLDALRRVGRKDEARRRAAAWLTRDPSGLHAARVRALLGALDEPRP